VANLAGFAGPSSWVDWQFLTAAHSSTPAEAGLYPAIAGSILLMVTVAALSFPLGVGAAVYLEEYAPENRFTRIIDVNISNLAGVPSVVYGLLGLGVFVTYLNQPTGTVFLGGATLALLILPIVIISSREAIRSVPEEMRQASYGMGATRWQTVKNVVLPRAFPGILTGTILSLGRAIGETAPLIMIGAPNVLFSTPTELSDKVGAMPLQVYAWAVTFAGPNFYEGLVPAGVVVLLVVLLAMNSVAIVLRNKYQSEA
ncbi:phosphate ABC transporter permease PstA, partial [Halobium palmae]